MCVHNSPRFLIGCYLRSVNQMKFIWCTSFGPSFFFRTKKNRNKLSNEAYYTKRFFFILALPHGTQCACKCKMALQTNLCPFNRDLIGIFLYIFWLNLITHFIQYGSTSRGKSALRWSGIVLASTMKCFYAVLNERSNCELFRCWIIRPDSQMYRTHFNLDRMKIKRNWFDKVLIKLDLDQLIPHVNLNQCILK